MGAETEVVLTAMEKIPGAGEIITIPFKIAKLFEPEPWERRLERLEQEVQALKVRVDEHERWLKELTNEVIGIKNGGRVTQLANIVTEIRKEIARIKQRFPDQRTRDEIVTNIGLELDKFIDQGDLWQWTSLRRTFSTNRDDVDTEIEDKLFDHFLVYVSLEVYGMGIAALLAGLHSSTGGGRPERIRQSDRRRIQNHIELLTIGKQVRGEWKASLLERVGEAISVQLIGGQKYVEMGECHWHSRATNRMLWIDEVVRQYTTAHPGVPRNTLCTIDGAQADALAGSDEEEYEGYHGATTIRELASMLENFLKHGFPLGEQFPRFAATPTRNNEWVYVVDPDGLLLWRRVNTNEAERVTTPWLGPKHVGDGWDKFAAVLPAGGNSIYAMKAGGPVLRYNHKGFNTGEFDWEGPQDVREPFPEFRSLVAGGDGVVYLIQEDGRLFWHRHDGLAGGTGHGTWREAEVGSGWSEFSTVFSTGNGQLFAMRPDGTLSLYRHNGFKDGTANWNGPVPVPIEPVEAIDGFGSGSGVFFIRTTQGDLLRYQLSGWQGPRPDVSGPALVASGLANARVIFGILPREAAPVG